MSAHQEQKRAYTIVADKSQLGPEVRDWLLLGFALIGVGLSVGAWLMQRGEMLIGCTVEGGLEQCMAVLLPVFANHLGVPIAWLGIAGYGLLVVLSAAVVISRPKSDADKDALKRWRSLLGMRRWLILGAFAFSVYFTWFQAVFIGEFCPVCLSSAATSVALLVVELTRPNTIHLAKREGWWWPRQHVLLVGAGVFVFVSAGVFVLKEVWHPLAEAEQTKEEFFARFDPAPGGPLYIGGKPTLVLGSKEGCPVCIQYFGATMQDPRVLEVLNDYHVIVAEIPDDQGAILRTGISHVPALAIVDGPDDAHSISGLRPVEQIIAFLRGEPVPLD